MLGKGKRSPSSSPSLTLHSTHLARRRSPFGMVRVLEKASDGLSSGPVLCGCARAFFWERVCMSACQRRGWGRRERENFVAQMKRVFPDRQLELLPLTHEIFHTFFDIDSLIQVPGFGGGCYQGP